MVSDVPQYNLKSTGVKRLMKEAAELRNPTEMYYAQPFEGNLFEWHFTVRGPADTDFDGGVYHGRILLPADYPMKPPSVILLTPNGRFQLNQKICLSISGHHPESWQPSWSIRTALLALIGFMPTHAAGALGSLEYPPEERRKLAKLSLDWICKECGLCMRNALLSGASSVDNTDVLEARTLAAQISFKQERVEKGEAIGGQDIITTVDTVELNNSLAMTPDVTSDNLRCRQSTQSRAVLATGNGDDILESSSRHHSWELLFIWLLSLIVVGLVLRRLFLLQSTEMA